MCADPKIDRTVQRASVVALIVIAVLTAAGLTYAHTLQTAADATVPAEEPCLAAGDWGTTTLTRNADRAAELDTDLAQAFDTYATHATHAKNCRAIPTTEGARP